MSNTCILKKTRKVIKKENLRNEQPWYTSTLKKTPCSLNPIIASSLLFLLCLRASKQLRPVTLPFWLSFKYHFPKGRPRWHPSLFFSTRGDWFPLLSNISSTALKRPSRCKSKRTSYLDLKRRFKPISRAESFAAVAAAGDRERRSRRESWASRLAGSRCRRGSR